MKLNAITNKVWLFALIGLFAVSCNRWEAKGSSALRTLSPNLASIQKDFVNDRCVSCHQVATSKNRNVDLRDLSMAIEGNGHPHTGPHMRVLVKPGCPKQSFFLSIMKEGKMPPSPGDKISKEEEKTIEEWITSLNPNAAKTCDDEPPDPPGGDEPN